MYQLGALNSRHLPVFASGQVAFLNERHNFSFLETLNDPDPNESEQRKHA